jgi:hypothetical protein
MMAIDAVVVAVQYGNIHCPLWTIREGPFKVAKYVLTVLGILFTACEAASIIFGQLNRSQNLTIFSSSHVIAKDVAISIAPFFIMAVVIACIYLTNWIRFCYQTGGMVVGRIVKREFSLVSVLALSDVIVTVCYAVFVANLAYTQDDLTCLYLWFFFGSMVPMLNSSAVGVYMFVSEKDIMENLLGLCYRRRSGYEILNN